MPFMKNKRTGEIIEVGADGRPVGNRPPMNPEFPYKGPQAAAALNNTGANTTRTVVQTQGDMVDNATKRATQSAVISRAQADAQRAQAEATARASEVAFARAHNGLNRQQWAEAQGGLDQMSGLNRVVGSLRDQYNQNFKGKGLGSAAEYLPAFVRPENGVFDNTAKSLLADLAKAKGLTSQQFNTPAEQKMFFEPLLPSRNDTDEEIVSKIDALQRMVNEGTGRFARQVGVGMRKAPLKPPPRKQAKQNRVIDFGSM